MIFARNIALMTRDLGSFAVRSGRWWLPALFVISALTILLAITLKTAVPSAVYVLF